MAIPTYLLIDAGNSRLKWATATERGPIRLAGEIATVAATSTWIRKLARMFPKHPIVLSSVVPKLIPIFRRAFSGRFHLVSGDSPALGLRFDYPKPSEIGADRLASAVAALGERRNNTPVIVVNCGTATAFSLLDAEGRFCGGVIAPGLHTQLAALIGAAAQLPKTVLHMPRQIRARSTAEAIRAGVMLNFQGGVKEIIRRLGDSLPAKPEPHVILTGGNARYLEGVLDQRATVRPLLVFEGLRMIGLRAFPPE